MKSVKIILILVVLFSGLGLLRLVNEVDPYSSSYTVKSIFFLSLTVLLIGLGTLVSSTSGSDLGVSLRRGLFLSLAVLLVIGIGKIGFFEFDLYHLLIPIAIIIFEVWLTVKNIKNHKKEADSSK